MTAKDPCSMWSDQEPAISAPEFAALVEMVGPDMPEVLIDLLDTYLEESSNLVGMLQAAKARGIEAEMLRPAHSLKSSSASVGAMRLSALCAALEDHLRGGQAMDVGAQVDQIQTELGRVQAALEAEKVQLRAG